MNSLSLSIRSSIQSPLHPPGSGNFGAERGEVSLSILAKSQWNQYLKKKNIWYAARSRQTVSSGTPFGIYRGRPSLLLGSEKKISMSCTRFFSSFWSP